jgi:hypothetical protein
MWSYVDDLLNLENVLKLALQDLRELSADQVASSTILMRTFGLVAGAVAWRTGDYEEIGAEALQALELTLSKTDPQMVPVHRARLLMAFQDISEQLAKGYAGYSRGAPTYKAALSALTPTTDPKLWAELQFKYGTAYWLEHSVDTPRDFNEVVTAFRSGLAALAAYPSEHRLRAFLLRNLRDVLANNIERVSDTLEVFDQELGLLAALPQGFHLWINAQNDKAAFLCYVGETRRDRRWINQSIATCKAAIEALEQATVEQKHTPDWLHNSELLPRALAHSEAALARLASH